MEYGASSSSFGIQGLSTIDSFGAKVVLSLHRSDLLNPSKYQLRNVDVKGNSIREIFENSTHPRALLTKRKLKGKFSRYIHYPIAYAVRSIAVAALVGICSPIGVVFNGSTTLYYLLRIGVKKIVKLRDRHSNNASYEWSKVHQFSRAFFSDLLFSCWYGSFLSCTVTAFLYPSIITIGLTIAYWSNNILRTPETAIQAASPAEQVPGLYKAFYLHKEFGLRDANGGILPSSEDDDEYRYPTPEIKGHFYNLHDRQAVRVYQDLKAITSNFPNLDKIGISEDSFLLLSIDKRINIFMKRIRKGLKAENLDTFTIDKITKKLQKNCDLFAQLQNVVINSLYRKYNLPLIWIQQFTLPDRPYLTNPSEYQPVY